MDLKRLILPKGRVKKKIVEYSLCGKKNLKTKNDLLAMKQILYDMGPLSYDSSGKFIV